MGKVGGKVGKRERERNKWKYYPMMPIIINAKTALSLVAAHSIGLKLYVITEPHDSNNRKLLNAASS